MFSFSSFPQPVQRYKSPYFRLKTITLSSSGNHFQPTAQPKEISRLQAGASTTLTDGTLLPYGCASGSFYDCPPAPISYGVNINLERVPFRNLGFYCPCHKYPHNRLCSQLYKFSFHLNQTFSRRRHIITKHDVLSFNIS